jgi:hypothetical protein
VKRLFIMKQLVIINGVTGAIGTACLAHFSRYATTTVIGLSRQGLPYSVFCTANKLPDCTLICSLDKDITSLKACRDFVESIQAGHYDEIFYIHAVGIYPFEVNNQGVPVVSHDDDNDGIDDRVLALSYKAFFAMASSLQKCSVPCKAVIFGGVADAHKPAVHASWWKVMGRIRRRMKKTARKGIGFRILNISSVICPSELLSRPYVFRDTNAHPRFWLQPHEVAESVAALLAKNGSYLEEHVFHQSTYVNEGYFLDAQFTPRKMAELGLALESSQ